MVRPQSIAAPAQAPWLGHLCRALTFGRDKRLILLRGAGPNHLGPVADLLWSLGPARICVRLAELSDVPHGSTALLVLRVAELSALNFIRPLFRERALRMVLLADDATVTTALEIAPDLLDWVSDVIEAEPLTPRFVVDGMQLIAQHFPGFTWHGSMDAAEAALADAFPGAICRRAPPPSDYAALVETLDAVRGWVIVPVSGGDAALQLRIALAESRRRGRVIAVGADVPGWPTVDPTVADWADLDRFAPPISGAEAAAVDCERAALGRGAIGPSIEAVVGAADLPTTRVTLRSAELPALRRVVYRRARQALKSGRSDARDAVAAWADRTSHEPDWATSAVTLAVVALSAAVRNGSSLSTLEPIALTMGWDDIAASWRSADILERHLTSAMDLLGEGDFGQAERLLREALDAASKRPGAASGKLRLFLLVLLGWATLEQGKLSTAESAFEEALSTVVGSRDAETPVHATILAGLGQTLATAGRLEEAEQTLDSAIQIYRACEFRRAPYGRALGALGGLAARRSEHALAEGYLREAASVLRSSVGRRRADHARVLVGLAQTLVQQGRYEEAEMHLDTAHTIFGQLHSSSPIERTTLIDTRAQLRLMQGRFSEAQGILEDALGLLEGTASLDDPVREAIQTRLALVRRIRATDRSEPDASTEVE